MSLRLALKASLEVSNGGGGGGERKGTGSKRREKKEAKPAFHVKYGQVVMIKLPSYPLWPAKLVHPSDVDDEELTSAPERRGSFLAHFFGSKQYAWVKKPHIKDVFRESEPTSDDRNLIKGFEDAKKWALEYADLIEQAQVAVPEGPVSRKKSDAPKRKRATPEHDGLEQLLSILGDDDDDVASRSGQEVLPEAVSVPEDAVQASAAPVVSVAMPRKKMLLRAQEEAKRQEEERQLVLDQEEAAKKASAHVAKEAQPAAVTMPKKRRVEPESPPPSSKRVLPSAPQNSNYPLALHEIPEKLAVLRHQQDEHGKILDELMQMMLQDTPPLSHPSRPQYLKVLGDLELQARNGAVAMGKLLAMIAGSAVRQDFLGPLLSRQQGFKQINAKIAQLRNEKKKQFQQEKDEQRQEQLRREQAERQAAEDAARVPGPHFSGSASGPRPEEPAFDPYRTSVHSPVGGSTPQRPYHHPTTGQPHGHHLRHQPPRHQPPPHQPHHHHSHHHHPNQPHHQPQGRHFRAPPRQRPMEQPPQRTAVPQRDVAAQTRPIGQRLEGRLEGRLASRLGPPPTNKRR